MPIYQCEFCRHVCSTSQGLKSHLAQRGECNAKLKVKYQPHCHSNDTDDAPSSHHPCPTEVNDPWIPDIPHHAARLNPGSIEPNPSQPTSHQFIKDFPDPAAKTYGQCHSPFERLHQHQEDENTPPFAPFDTLSDWQLAKWLATCGASQTKINDFLDIDAVSSLVPLQLNSWTDC